MSKDGFGGYLEFRPIVIRDLTRWYKKHKATEHIWGSLSLYRPDARVIRWETIDSTGNKIPRCKLEAVRNRNPDAGSWPAKHGSNGTRIYKPPGQPLILTLSDLMGWLDHAWRRWINSEHEEHDRWHDNGAGCMGDQGIPRERCLRSGNGTDDVDDVPCEKFGPRMTMDEHIDMMLEAASL
ncbi:hypothetical protein DE146DRAFT_286059 [Phaeosphaeria sp. MPI-PUGE-AT-0046c]|nr:hypothetical protein DE146DRAFT_286059 [Phaeosphaeria sp. MPI-PUGE-AT-0046c]